MGSQLTLVHVIAQSRFRLRRLDGVDGSGQPLDTALRVRHERLDGFSHPEHFAKVQGLGLRRLPDETRERTVVGRVGRQTGQHVVGGSDRVLRVALHVNRA